MAAGATLRWTYDHAPTDISLTLGSVAENQPTGTVVGSLSATDPDPPDDAHSYSLVSGEGDTDNGSFTIVGSELRTAAVFDYEAQASYSIRVRTTDQSGLWCEKAFVIPVLPETLLVTGMTPNPSGFSATFNHPVSTAEVNLYDDSAQALGPRT
ncbi:MAG: cadherin repeat domain-containing protein [Planctomycetota bacterium]|nr:cadherin repeat domain-containing protein [Planctomycetota bacterium]